MSDYYLRNASFVRCDNITLRHTWDNLLNDKLRLRLFGAVQIPLRDYRIQGLSTPKRSAASTTADILAALQPTRLVS